MHTVGNKMKKMVQKSTGNVFEVIRHVILVNGWEYYITELEMEGSCWAHGWAFVCGFENEFGTFDMNEIRPYIQSECSGDELNEILPAIGCEWVD